MFPQLTFHGDPPWIIVIQWHEPPWSNTMIPWPWSWDSHDLMIQMKKKHAPMTMIPDILFYAMTPWPWSWIFRISYDPVIIILGFPWFHDHDPENPMITWLWSWELHDPMVIILTSVTPYEWYIVSSQNSFFKANVHFKKTTIRTRTYIVANCVDNHSVWSCRKQLGIFTLNFITFTNPEIF